jgi:hypothetical protein
MGPLSGFFSDDFVRDYLNQQGLGGIEIVGVTAQGFPDPEARLHATARIWTPRPDGSAGTMSQTFPALAMPGSTARAKSIFGLRRTTQFRLNVGISNPSEEVHRFRVTARINDVGGNTSVQYEVLVQPRSIDQRTVETGLQGLAQVLIENLTAGTATDWQGWASTIDNASGDAWSQIAFPTPTAIAP